MKRILITAVCALLLCGCARQERAAFYYRRASFLYHSPDGVIVSESRDISGQQDQLSFLISVYLIGPQSPDAVSPFPDNTKLLSAEKTENLLCISLSDNLSHLSDAEFSLACTCMTLTFLDLAQVDAVSISSGPRTLTLTRDIITLYDSEIPSESTGG